MTEYCDVERARGPRPKSGIFEALLTVGLWILLVSLIVVEAGK